MVAEERATPREMGRRAARERVGGRGVLRRREERRVKMGMRHFVVYVLAMPISESEYELKRLARKRERAGNKKVGRVRRRVGRGLLRRERVMIEMTREHENR